MITESQLRAIAPRARPDYARAILAADPATLAQHGIDSPLKLAHLLAQAAHETGGLVITEENLNYRAERIRQVWPSRPGAVKFAHDPRGLANCVYGGRMGNRPGTDDGWNFRGRGLAQHTGRDGYAAVAGLTGLPLVENPALVLDPANALTCLAAFWRWKRLGEVARDATDASVRAVTRRWNGGLVGIADRIARFRVAHRVLVRGEAASGAAAAVADEARADAAAAKNRATIVAATAPAVPAAPVATLSAAPDWATIATIAATIGITALIIVAAASILRHRRDTAIAAAADRLAIEATQ